jgi:hypothetical protein
MMQLYWKIFIMEMGKTVRAAYEELPKLVQ